MIVFFALFPISVCLESFFFLSPILDVLTLTKTYFCSAGTVASTAAFRILLLPSVFWEDGTWKAWIFPVTYPFLSDVIFVLLLSPSSNLRLISTSVLLTPLLSAFSKASLHNDSF